MTIRIKNDEEDEEVDCVTKGEINGRALRCNEVLERVAETVIYYKAHSLVVVAVFQWLALLATDVEDGAQAASPGARQCR